MSRFKKYYRETFIILVLIICFSLLGSFRLPSWIFACRVGSTSQPEQIINVSRSELEQFPPIVEALYLADMCKGVHPTEYVKTSNNEGMRIVKHFGAQPQRRNVYWLHLNVEGQLYQISIRMTVQHVFMRGTLYP